jgi:tRNA threonylcarbamoyl adenosine modification protein YjeE
MAILTKALADEAATTAFGRALAPVIRAGDLFRLEGDLGAGKSTLARAVIAALTGVKEAPSPTFTLVETYAAEKFSLWHFDLYRLDEPADVWELGLEEALDGGVLLVEWPERIAGLLPDSALTIRLEIKGEARVAKISGGAHWQERLHRAGIA